MAKSDADIGRAISRIRGEMSQKELGERMADRGWKWSQSTVWAVESGKRPLRYGEAVDLCWITGTEMRDLEGDEQDLNASFFANQHLRHFDVLRDALRLAMQDQLENARSADQLFEFDDERLGSIGQMIRSDDLLSAATRLFRNIAREELAKLEAVPVEDRTPLAAGVVWSWNNDIAPYNQPNE